MRTNSNLEQHILFSTPLKCLIYLKASTIMLAVLATMKMEERTYGSASNRDKQVR
jgi:hypothetical protein